MSSLSSHVSKFLKNRSNFLSIHFNFYGTTINADAFSQVGKAVEKGKIKVEYWNDADGQYGVDDNTIRLPHEKDLDAMGAIIVHEAVHAYHDLLGVPVSEARDEGAAFTAQALYMLSRGKDEPDNPAYELARHFKTGKGKLDELVKNLFAALKGAQSSSGAALYNLKATTTYNGVP